MSLNRAVAPPFQPIHSLDILPLQTVTLQNNAPLHWLGAGESPVLKLEVVFRVGQAHENKHGVNQMAIKMLSEGTKTRSASEITHYFDSYGAFLETSAGNDRSSVVLYCLTKHLESLLPAFCELLTDAIFPATNLEQQKLITSQNQRVQEEKNNFVAQVLFRENLFGAGNAYGKTPSSADYLHITREDIMAHYAAFMQGKNFELFLVGQVGEQEVRLIDKHLGAIDLQAPNMPTPIIENPTYAGKRVLIEKKESMQSSVRLGNLCIDKKHPDFFAYKVINEVFGGYFGSRLMSNIREEKGYTYGIYSSIVNMHRASYTSIGADVKKEFTQQTLDEIKKEIHILHTQLIPDEELERVRNYMLGSLAGNMTTAFDLVEVFKGIHFSEMTYAYYTDYVKTIQTITPEELQNTARQYLRHDDMVEVIVGGV